MIEVSKRLNVIDLAAPRAVVAVKGCGTYRAQLSANQRLETRGHVYNK